MHCASAFPSRQVADKRGSFFLKMRRIQMAGKLQPYTKEWTERGMVIDWIRREHFESRPATIERHRGKMRALMAVEQLKNLRSKLESTHEDLKATALLAAIIDARDAMGEDRSGGRASRSVLHVTGNEPIVGEPGI
jgi:hypothetical protein